MRYALLELAGQGHCGYPQPGVIRATAEHVEIEPELAQEAVDHAVQEGAVVREEVDGTPWLSLQHLHEAEAGLRSRSNEFTRLAHTPCR